MTKRSTTKTTTPRIVASGDGWRIEFYADTREYAAYDVCGLVGFVKTETAARILINSYRTK